jgi:hypothetical protein
MAVVQVDRHVVVSANADPNGSMRVDPGEVDGMPVVMLEIVKDGVRVSVLLHPNEAETLGLGFIRSAAVSMIRGAPAAKAPAQNGALLL